MYQALFFSSRAKETKKKKKKKRLISGYNMGETAVHGCHCQGDMTVRMRQVLARPWVGVRVSLALNSCLARFTD